jgi:hypothetical protein
MPVDGKLWRSQMTDQESRSFFLGAALAATLLIGGSMLRDAMTSNPDYANLGLVTAHLPKANSAQSLSTPAACPDSGLTDKDNLDALPAAERLHDDRCAPAHALAAPPPASPR